MAGILRRAGARRRYLAIIRVRRASGPRAGGRVQLGERAAGKSDEEKNVGTKGQDAGGWVQCDAPPASNGVCSYREELAACPADAERKNSDKAAESRHNGRERASTQPTPVTSL